MNNQSQKPIITPSGSMKVYPSILAIALGLIILLLVGVIVNLEARGDGYVSCDKRKASDE